MYRGQVLYEDRLLDSEESIAIGRAYVSMNDKVTAAPSFMPSTNCFLSNNLGMTGWSDAAEDMFRSWDLRYRTHEGGVLTNQPPQASKWPRDMGTHHNCQKIVKMVVREDAKAFLSEYKDFLM
jgi:hypothetical protein